MHNHQASVFISDTLFPGTDDSLVDTRLLYHALGYVPDAFHQVGFYSPYQLAAAVAGRLGRLHRSCTQLQVSTPPLVIVINSAPRSAHTGKDDATGDEMLLAQTIYDDTILGYSVDTFRILLAWQLIKPESIQVIVGHKKSSALKDLTKGSQFRSYEYLPKVHVDFIRGLLEKNYTLNPITLLPLAFPCKGHQALYLGKDGFGNGRLLLPENQPLSEFIKSLHLWYGESTQVQIVDPCATGFRRWRNTVLPRTVQLFQTLGKDTAGQAAIWNSSSYLRTGDEDLVRLPNLNCAWPKNHPGKRIPWIDNLTPGSTLTFIG